MKNIHILPTRLASEYYITKEGKLEESYALKRGGAVHFYITNDEEIKEGDYVVRKNYDTRYLGDTFNNLNFNQVVRSAHNCKPTIAAKKIILTTDQELIKDGVQAIDDDFLKWFVKNPSYENIEIKECPDYEFNIFGYYKIIIPKEEPKQIKCYDKYNQVLSESDYVDVQKDGVQLIYKKEDNQLYFKPYGKENKVSAYFSNDLVKCDEVGNWINNDRYEIIGEEPKQETLKEADQALTQKKLNINHITTQLDKEESISYNTGYFDGIRFQQERSYSEEEVLILINKLCYDLGEDNSKGIEWFKQFKKK